MPRISLWKGPQKTNDYNFQDRMISGFITSSGTPVYVHKYIGAFDEEGNVGDLMDIQDIVFLENRDRKYSDEVYEMRGTYNVTDSDYDLKQFGLFLTGDNVFIEFHLNDMIALIGRKIIPGDVLELPHQRDDFLLNGGDSINKYYVVEDATRASDGYSSTWLPHIWRVKLSPMTNSQEYADILDNAAVDPFGLETGSTIGELITTIATEMEMNEDIIEEAKSYVFARNFDTTMYYVVPGEELGAQNPWIYAGDGIPPNGAILIGSGTSFPLEDFQEGDYFLRVDYSPHTLYRRGESRWIMQELDYRRSRWSAYSRLLEDFWNNDNTAIMEDGIEIAERTALSKTIKPETDF